MNHLVDLHNLAPRTGKPFLLITLTVVFLFPGLQAHAGSPDSGRTVHFPEDHAIGKLYIRDASPLSDDLRNDHWAWLCNAQGAVKVPDGKQLRLTVPSSIKLDLKPLEKLGQGDLQALDLMNTKIDDTGLASISRLTGLRALRLDKTEITPVGLGLFKGLASLSYLSLNDLSVGHEGLAQIEGLVMLEALELERTGVTDLSLAHLQSLKQLKRLKLGGNDITDAGLASLAQISSLEELSLDSTQVTDAGMPQLTTLKSLRRMAFPLQITQAAIDLFRILPHFEMPFPRKNMVIRVVDEDGKTPVSCTVTVNSTTSCCIRAPQEFAVDESGVLQFAYSVIKDGFLSVTTEKTDYPSMSVFWTDPASTSMPVDLTISMEKGITIGGRVIDEGGQGIPNAQVIQRVANVATDGNDAGSRPGVPSPGVGGYDSIRTDAEGFWRANRIPKDFAGGGFQAIHPDYCSNMRDNAFRRSFSREELVSQTAVTVMKRGLTLKGTVLDPEGHPVIDAIVSQGEEYAIGIPPTHTDGDGRYEFKHVFPGELSLTVSADGYASACQQRILTGDPPLIDFQLEPCLPSGSKVVDMEGKPIRGGLRRSQYVAREKPVRVWYTLTGVDGKFCWNNAPSEIVMMTVDAEEYERGTDHPVIAGATEYVVTLFDQLKVVGTVVDDQSGKPLKDFLVYEGQKDSQSDQFHWSAASNCTVGEGTFEIKHRDPSQRYRIRVKKVGYEPSTSEPFPHGPRVVPLEFRLKKGDSQTGIIKSPDGQILKGVDVYLVPPDYGFTLNNGRVDGIGGECEALKTDEFGRFQLGHTEGPSKIVVAEDSGYAEIGIEELKSCTECILKPWGKVVVDVRIGGHPAAAEELTLNLEKPERISKPFIYHQYSGRADQKGHYEFDRVKPCTATIEWSVSREPRMTAYSHSQEVVVKPRETTHVILGGTGCPITGKIVAPENSSLQGQLHHSYAFIQLTLPWPFDQKALFEMSQSEKEAWKKEFFATELGVDYQRRLKAKPQVSFAIEPDGSFRAPDVPPGTYSLSVSVFQLNPGQPYRKETIARIDRLKITIPEILGGRSDVPFDLGELPLTFLK